MPAVTIDGKTVQVREGATVLEAARAAGADIPTLCNHEALEPWGGCRLCLVDVTRKEWDGWCKMVVSCMYPVEDGLIVHTRTERVNATRKVVLDLLLARCPETPLIQKLAAEYGVEETSYVPNPAPTDCILCGLCTRVCDHIGVSAISSVDRGAGREIAPPFNAPPPDCIGCLACAEICPTDCIPFKTSDTKRTIWGKDFEMQRCPKCGRAHITKAQATYYAGRGGVPESYFEMCDSCKRLQQAETFASLAAPR
ncbi:MAG: 2Fe-2S iron-sulfur cluster-binding protein [Acidobacteriota bacterium]|jgi:bidirectional [NiFe] hydrogenase diaphorase subunit